MIKTTKKGIKIEGNVPEVLTNLTQIIAAVKEAFEAHDISTEDVKKDIEKCVELAFMSEEELEKNAKESLGNLLREMADAIGKGDGEND